MASVRLWLAAMVAAWIAGPCAAAPLEAYGRLPTIEAAAISPSGDKLAVIWTDGEGRKVVLKNLRTGKIDKVLAAGEIKVRDLDWAGDEHLLITVSTTAKVSGLLNPRREWTMAMVYDSAEDKMRPLIGQMRESMNVIAGPPWIRVIDGKPYVYFQGVHFVGPRGRLSLFKADLDAKRVKLFEEGSDDTRDWLVGADGRALARTDYNFGTGRWSIKTHTASGWREVKAGQAYSEWPDLVGIGRDGRTVLVSEFAEGSTVLHEIVPETPVWGEPMMTQELEGQIWDPADHRLIGFRGLVGDDYRHEFFDPRDQAVWRAVQAAFPGEIVRLSGSSADRRRFVVLVDSAKEGAAYALVDLDAKSASWIGGLYQDLRVGDISPVKSVRYAAADGMMLSGYLTAPHGAQLKALPLVVLPHGGPAVRDTPGFDWWAQALASRGYAVLQVNFRGSGGYGWEFLSSGFGEWGRKMQTDLSDGVRYLASEGIVDPKRVCIVGASYGGYAALAGATLDPGVYRCAASVAGPSDLRRMVSWSKQQNTIAAQRYWLRFMGAEDPRDPVLGQLSPALLADKVDIPILLVHGRDDTVVPLEQSRYMAEALERAGKPVELVIEKGEDHWLSRGDTRLQMLQSVVTFLEKNNPPD